MKAIASPPTHGSLPPILLVLLGAVGLGVGSYFLFSLGGEKAVPPPPESPDPSLASGESLAPEEPAEVAPPEPTPPTRRYAGYPSLEDVTREGPREILAAVAVLLAEEKIDESLEILQAIGLGQPQAVTLRSFLEESPFKVLPVPPRLVGETRGFHRYALALSDPLGTETKKEILVDLHRNAEGKWRIGDISLPALSPERPALVLERADRPVDERQVDIDGALQVADRFVQAVVTQDFAAAKALVLKEKIRDARIAALCIFFEESGYQLDPERPLYNTVMREAVAWFLSDVESASGAKGRFGVILHRVEEDWKVAEINLDKLIELHAQQFGTGDAYYTPLVKKPEGGDVLALFFSFDEDELHPRALRQLEIVAELLRADPDKTIRISGHTDSRGTQAYNENLSARRAKEVRQTLLNYGVPEAQVLTEAFGYTQPLRPNENADGSDNPDGRKVNRRTEIYLDF
ncbi:MAG: OmpA family protein [Verrucomicrobiota bacterium]